MGQYGGCDGKTCIYDMHIDTRWAEDQPRYLGHPKCFDMWIPEEILKCVAFIGVSEDDEKMEKRFVPCGTVFFVSVPFETSTLGSYTYLVTARHNIEEIGLREMYIRINYKNGTAKTVLMDTVQWYMHPDDEDADIAVTPFHWGEADQDIKTVALGNFLSTGHITDGKVGIGNEVFVTGLFTKHYGNQRNMPIVRVGNLAMIPDEKVQVRWHNHKGLIDAYLIEARSIGGISGSPVFFREPESKGPLLRVGSSPFHLGGLIHGHWPTKESMIDMASPHDERNVNMGIAIVVPASKIKETINQKILKDMRMEYERLEGMKDAAVLD